MEDELRRSVFLKAFGAVRDMRVQLRREGINSAIPELRVTWKRDELWKLLIVETASDMEARRTDLLATAVIERFQLESQKFVSLAELCSDSPTTDEGRLRVERTVADMIRKKSLLPSCAELSSYLLATDPRRGPELVSLCRTADVTDSLFHGILAAQHEMKLYSSPFGSTYIESTVTPRIAGSCPFPELGFSRIGG